jgi:hypothetical protein
MSYGVWIVTSRPVGWGSLASGRTAAVVARSQPEAVGLAIEALGLQGRTIVDEETARGVTGTGEADRIGLGRAIWLSVGEVDFAESNAAVYGLRLADLISAYDEMRERNVEVPA